MTYSPRPFYYTRRFCITAIFTVIATAIVLSTSGSGLFHSDSQLHAAKKTTESSATKNRVTKDEEPAASADKIAEPIKSEAAKTDAKSETKTDERQPERAVSKAVEKDVTETGDKSRIRNVTFDTIKFDMKKGDNFDRKMITPAIEKLHGKKIRIGGYILPSGENEITEGFFLTRDNAECCFGPGAIVYDRIWVELKPDVVQKYVTKSVRVTGKFEIKYMKDPIDDSYMAVYQLSDVEVK